MTQIDINYGYNISKKWGESEGDRKRERAREREKEGGRGGGVKEERKRDVEKKRTL